MGCNSTPAEALAVTGEVPAGGKPLQVNMLMGVISVPQCVSPRSSQSQGAVRLRRRRTGCLSTPALCGVSSAHMSRCPELSHRPLAAIDPYDGTGPQEGKKKIDII